MENPFFAGYYTEEELRQFGFKKVGHNVKIYKNCNIVGLENIEIGDNVRIDSFCTLIAPGDGFIRLGSYIHIAGYCLLSGGSGIIMDDFSGVSHGVCLYSRSDDYSGKYMTNPMVPEEYTGVTSGTVHLGRHVIIGSGSVVLPGTCIEEGSSIGALSLVTRSLSSWGVYSGVPAKRLRDRRREMLEYEQKMLDKLSETR